MDDRARLAHEIDDLETEVADLRDQLAAVEAEVAEAEAEAAGVGAGRRRGKLVILSVAIALVGVAVAMVVTFFGAGAETMYGRVVAADGPAPAAVGTGCTVFFTPSGGEDYDGKLDVLCGRALVYGGGSLGYVECSSGDVGPAWCTDPDFSADGGDPRLSFDRRARALEIDDADPSWSLTIELFALQGGR